MSFNYKISIKKYQFKSLFNFLISFLKRFLSVINQAQSHSSRECAESYWFRRNSLIENKKYESNSQRQFPLRKGLGGFLLLMLITLQVQSQKLNVSINADTILIGDIYSLEMSVENIGNSKIFFPEFTDTIGNGKIEIVETYPNDTLGTKILKKWDLSIYYPGVFQVAGFSALLQHENGIIDTLKSFDPVTIYVKTIEVDTSKAFKPIKAPKSIPYPYKEVAKKYGPYLLGLIALISLLIYLWYRYKNKDVPKYIKPKTALDFHQEAISKLKEIDQQKLWQEGNIKEYYLEISETLRTYIEGRFDVNAMESTTDEIIEDFLQDGLNKALTKKLKEVLQQCDLAKFAKFQPLGEENMRMMKMAQNFVAHTKPKPVIVNEKIENNG